MTTSAPLPLDRDTLLTVFEGDRDRLLRVKEISDLLGLPHTERAAVRQLVRSLVEGGDLLAHSGRRFSLAAEGSLIEGIVQRHRHGYAWLLPEDDTIRDAFLPPEECQDLLDGDRVLCSITPSRKGPVGKVVKILNRARQTLPGTLRRQRRAVFAECEGGFSQPILIPEGDEGGAEGLEDGTVVEILIVRFPTTVTSAVGRVVRVIGKEGDIRVQVERLVTDAGIVRPFSGEALVEAEQLPTVPEESETVGRLDLRSLPLCTIDGETAKDFDDAVYAEPQGKNLRVIVAIADVAHYVRPQAALDEDAFARGTSVYYPGHCIPMLPEKLSNGLCSLNPHVVRLCMVADLLVSKKGKVLKKHFANGVMRSQARLTYTQVQAFFDGDKAVLEAIPEPVQRSLYALREASRALREQRKRRGSMDFDFVERVIHVGDEGEPVAIHPLDRAESHRLIEDLMIAANEAVATHFEERELPCVYRIHEPPDPEKLEKFQALARTVTRADPEGEVSAKALSTMMDRLKGHRLKGALDYLLLRAMMQARYSASNVGHFGLGSEAYLHFTSPIRRYPDLVVHRLLKDFLARPKHKPKDPESEEEALEDIAVQCSELERRATDAERKISSLYAAWFVRDRVGEEFVGTVSGCSEFGVFIRFDSPDVEGMVHVAQLGGDYFRYDEMRLRLFGERSGFEVGIGDRVRVLLAGVDLGQRRINLELVRVLEQNGRTVDIAPPPPRGEGEGSSFRGRGRGEGGRSGDGGGRGAAGRSSSAGGQERHKDGRTPTSSSERKPAGDRRVPSREEILRGPRRGAEAGRSDSGGGARRGGPKSGGRSSGPSGKGGGKGGARGAAKGGAKTPGGGGGKSGKSGKSGGRSGRRR